MASLDLLPRKEFTLTLSDGSQVSGQFGTWALSRLGQKRKLSLTKLNELLSNDPPLDALIDYVICAIEYKSREAKSPVIFSDVQLCTWMDDYNDGALEKLLVHSGGEATDEKKSPPVLNGQNSSDTLLAQA